MKNFLLSAALFFCCYASFSQVVINELDADTPSTDVMEFIELKSATPNFPLDGYVLVFFNATTNGDSNLSYLAIDLDGYTTDLNGIFLLGNPNVTPSPAITIGVGIIQNGLDAVAIYHGNAADFPTNTAGTTANLIDALCYSNSNTIQPTALMTALNQTVCVNENQGSAAATKSIQRKNDGTYEVKFPTPGANNDGSGQTLNGVTLSLNPTEMTEGTSFTVTFTTQTAVTSNLNITFALANGSFTTADYSGNLSVLIPQGSTTGSTIIQLTDDAVDEGDENLKVVIGTLPDGYTKLNDNTEFRVHDNDYVVHAWGTPLNPTYGLVTSTVPVGYYNSLEGKSGAVLKQAIQDIIANPAVVRKQNYGDIVDILKEADQNPENGSQVWLMYVEKPRSKIDFQTGTSGAAGFWNREHIYCQSRGGFTNETSSDANGINNYDSTNADDIMAGHADGHHLRAEDSPENSLRSERNYGVDYNGLANTHGSWHGDVARAIFYMCVRYNGLNVVNGNPPQDPDGYIGDLATLLQWNVSDPSDDFEMNRNNVVYNWQKNRNPFIDYPNLADYIWGSHAGEVWFSTLSVPQNEAAKIGIYPNPAKDQFRISGIESGHVEIFSVTGQKVFESDFSGSNSVKMNISNGVYTAKITAQGQSVVKKLVIK
ncbi:endonuclease [Flavobacterium sp. 3HN19-14]|uniref:endonuclease n=1 Tax=Flavobacterium sp. 3HN19-14 TaxID=3448133 RepID=UPI003EE2D24E